MLYKSEDTLSGKKGSSVYLKNGVKRQYKMPTNPNTPAQAQRRAALAGNSNAYRQLGAGAQEEWSLAAANYPRTNRVGNSYKLSGAAFFVSVNQNIQNLKEQLGDENTEDKLLVPSAPLITGYPSLREQIGENEEETFVVQVQGSTDLMNADVSYVLVSATVASSKGKRFFGRSAYRTIGAFDKTAMGAAVTAGLLDIGTEYAAKFGSLPPAGTRVAVKFEGIEKTEGVLRPSGSMLMDFVPATP